MAESLERLLSHVTGVIHRQAVSGDTVRPSLSSLLIKYSCRHISRVTNTNVIGRSCEILARKLNACRGCSILY